MKKSSLIMGMGVLMLASCSNDELVNPVIQPAAGQQSISFVQRIGNQSRDTEGLENVFVDFGVWGVKGEKQSSAFASISNADLVAGATVSDGVSNIIMNQYLVGFWKANYGYYPTHNQQKHGTATNYDWYYEGLGSTENWYTWDNDAATGGASDAGFAAATSKNANQYLKYWDHSAAYTYFYAYAPYAYTDGTNAPQLKKNASGEPYIEFPTISGAKTTLDADGVLQYTEGNCADVMYAGARVPETSYDSEVTLTFNRLLSKIRLAFYETVPGYKVELVALNTGSTGTNNGIVLVPTAFDASHTPNYYLGSYVKSGNAIVTYKEAADLTTWAPQVSYATGFTTSQDPFYFQTYNATAGTDGLLVEAGETVVANMTLTPWVTVVPVNGENTNDGFTLNATLRFTSLDTGEVFYVYGAQVYIPAGKVQWAPNTLYTYVFRISTGVTGDTGTPGPDVAYGPDTNSALKPIIFEDVLVNKYSEVDVYADDTTDPKVPFEI